jgi:hypothetical protein
MGGAVPSGAAQAGAQALESKFLGQRANVERDINFEAAKQNQQNVLRAMGSIPKPNFASEYGAYTDVFDSGGGVAGAGGAGAGYGTGSGGGGSNRIGSADPTTNFQAKLGSIARTAAAKQNQIA